MSAPRKYRVWDGEGMNRVDFRLRPDGTVSFLIYDKNEGRKEKNIDSDVASTVCQTVDEEVEVGWKDDSDLVVMQYTGLTDAEGQEIWEGDFITYDNTSAPDVPPQIIVWDEEDCGWARYHPDWFDRPFSIGRSLRDLRRLRVIGNRYENPELLKPADA